MGQKPNPYTHCQSTIRVSIAAMFLWLALVAGAATGDKQTSNAFVSTEAAKCGFQADTDCHGNDIGGVTNKTEFMTAQACCLLCSKTPRVRTGLNGTVFYVCMVYYIY